MIRPHSQYNLTFHFHLIFFYLQLMVNGECSQNGPRVVRLAMADGNHDHDSVIVRHQHTVDETVLVWL